MSSRALAWPVCCCLAASIAGAAAPASIAHAQCTEDTPSVGVLVRHCTSASRRWAEVRADLDAVDVGVRVSRPAERGTTAEAFAGSVRGVVAIAPAARFEFPSFAPEGLTVGEGERWPDHGDDPRLAVLALDDRSGAIAVPPEQVVPFEAWMFSVLSGTEVLRDGAVPGPCLGAGCDRAPRTAIGLSREGRTLVIVAAGGFDAATPGVTASELGEMMETAGAYDALSTAEGATSVLWAGGAFAIPSSDGASRPSAAWLAVYDRASGDTIRIEGVVKAATASGAALPAATIRVETPDGRRVASGGTLTSGAYWQYTLPRREYVIRASLTGYRTGCRYCAASPDMPSIWCSVFLVRGTGSESCPAPPRGVDAGPWPEGDAGTPTDAAAGGDGSPGSADAGCGCRVASRCGDPASSAVIAMAAGSALAIRRSRRRRA